MASPRQTALVLAMLVVLVSVMGASGTGPPGGEACAQRGLSASYVTSVDRAVRSKEDMWGNALLPTSAGPSYERVRSYLKPLLMAHASSGKPLTASGFHYLAFTRPSGAEGSGSAALHVADGSQIVSQRASGSSLTIGVGRAGRERYGSCLARLTLPTLAEGHLPILETGYIDAQGVRYQQESFAARISETTSLVSFVRVTADARHARSGVEIRFVPSPAGEEAVTYRLPTRTMLTAYVAWSNSPSPERFRELDRADYQAARASVIRYWRERLSGGVSIDVPERRVHNAVQAILIQNLGLTWRYSMGNPYQQFSFPEGVDVAQVMSSYGFSDVSTAILLRSLVARRGPYPNWRTGQKLIGAALHYRLFRDRSVIAEVTPELRRGVSRLGQQITGGRGLLDRERYSSDIPDLVHGLHSQAVVWQGLREMSSVWSDTGQPELAARSRHLAARLGQGLRRAVRASSRTLPDGSLFVPVRLLDDEGPYDSVTETRAGSYWNLVMPYALASGLFQPGSREAHGLLTYMLRHGSRMLGLVRAGAYPLYGRDAAYPTSGVNPVYGLNVSRSLADNDQPDQLVLSLYGQLAVGMAPGTFVSGEAASVSPLAGEYYRTMYLPPNGASNASFLETLRLMLVHETRDGNGVPHGLELAYATPRQWLDPAKRIAMRNLPTSFGPISFSMRSLGGQVHVSVDVPSRSRPRTLVLRLRLPREGRISMVTVAGRPFRRFDSGAETIDLSGLTGRLDLKVNVATK